MKNQKEKLLLVSSLCGVVVIILFSTIVFAESFQEQRNRFREEIKYKKEIPLDKDGLYIAVMFDKDKGAWDFGVSPGESRKIKDHLREYFSVTDEDLLDEMTGRMNSGHIIVYKEFSPEADGVNLKTAFLSPRVPCWNMLTDINGIEDLFHVYNFSVVFGKKSPRDTYCLLQTQGTFFGFTKAVTLPLLFHQDDATHTLEFSMPTESELSAVVNQLPALNPERATLEERFIDTCRTHPMFQERDEKGNYVVSDERIIAWLNDNILHKDSECDVKNCYGHWTIYQDFDDYYLASYSLLTTVNIAAFIPPNIPAISYMVKRFAQTVSDEVSARYLPLSMKNFRDHTVAAASEKQP
jgi:hypothetical protein